MTDARFISPITQNLDAFLKGANPSFVSDQVTDKSQHEFMAWFESIGGASVARVTHVSELAAAYTRLESEVGEASLIELGIGILVGRAFYSQMRKEQSQLQLIHDDPLAADQVASLMHKFDEIIQIDESYAETLARNLASIDADVLNMLYDSAPNFFAQGLVLSWMGALVPWVSQKNLCQ